MLFISKRNKGQSRRSTKETCFLLIGLLIAVGCIGGLSGLIYGKKNENKYTMNICIIVSVYFF